MGTPSLAFFYPSHLLLQGCIYNIRPSYIVYFIAQCTMAIITGGYNTQCMQCGYDQCDVQLSPPKRCSAQIWDSEEAVSVLYMTWNLLVLPNSANPRCDATHYSWNSYGMPYCTYYSHLYICGAVRHITCGLPWARFTIIPSITHQ